MKPTAPGLSRRAFLNATAAGGAALVLGFRIDSHAAPAAAATAFAPNAWIRIDPGGAVEFLIAKTEMGQGAVTGIGMILAEELDADWARVSVRTIRPDGTRFMITGGSYSISGAWDQGRHAAAAAREMLLRAGAAALGVEPSACRTANHAVTHPASGRSVDYGALVEHAAALSPLAEPPLKDPARYTLVGRELPARDRDAIVNATAVYGSDVRLPGMRYASIERSPVVNGSLAGVDETAARAVAGVEAVVTLPGNRFPTLDYLRDGVAVVARSSWAALQGRRALAVRWNPAREGGRAVAGSLVSSAELAQAFAHALQEPAPAPGDGLHAEAIAIRSGSAEALAAAFAGAARTLEMEYALPLQAHAPMEPMNATAHWSEAGCEVWAPCHFQSRLLDALQRLTGLPVERIHIHTPLLGGSFGRRLDVDYALEAVALSRRIGQPVQVLWTREDDTRFGLYSPPSRHSVRVALDRDGNLAAMDHAFTALSVWQQQEPQEIEPSGLDYAASIDAIKFPYAVANRVVRHRLLERPVRVFWWRRGYTPNHTFVNECVLDECAHAAGADPLAFRLRLLGEPRRLGFPNKGETDSVDTGRLAGVLRAAAQAAGWDTPLPAGRGRGIASTVTDTHVAVVVEAAVEQGRIRVPRVVVAVDCGIVINPQLVRAQVEGSVAFALTAALKGEITLRDGSVQQGNFDDYPLLAIDEMPRVDTVLVASREAPTGTGEQISHPVGAALANAVFAATGRRLRSLPLRLGDALSG